MRVILILLIYLTFQPVFSQENPKKEKSIVTVSFKVRGVCNMCKDRIQDAAIYTRGVKKAVWEKETQQLEVIFNTKNTSEEKIHQAIAKAGHDTSKAIAEVEVYEQLPDCCRYRDGVDIH